MKTVTLLRHLQSEAFGRQAAMDPPLTALGRRQSLFLCRELAGQEFDVGYISELRRTRDSARLLTTIRVGQWIEDRRINELHAVGDWRNFTRRDVSRLIERETRHLVPIDRVETDAEFLERIRTFWDMVIAKPHPRVVIMGHSNVIKAIVAQIFRANDATFGVVSLNCPHGSVTVLELGQLKLPSGLIETTRLVKVCAHAFIPTTIITS